MLEPEYSKEAASVLDDIEHDPTRSLLWQRLCDALDLICDHPDSADARAGQIRVFEAGLVYWSVRVRVQAEDRDWAVIWRQEGDLALIAYIGPEPR